MYIRVGNSDLCDRMCTRRDYVRVIIVYMDSLSIPLLRIGFRRERPTLALCDRIESGRSRKNKAACGEEKLKTEKKRQRSLSNPNSSGITIAQRPSKAERDRSIGN